MTAFHSSSEVSLSRREWLQRTTGGAGLLALSGLGGSLLAQQPAKSGKVGTPPPTRPPLQPVDLGEHPPGVERLDLFLLLGQSNMKGRGVMPDEPKRDPRPRSRQVSVGLVQPESGVGCCDTELSESGFFQDNASALCSASASKVCNVIE